MAWFQPENGKFYTTSGYITSWSTAPDMFTNPQGEGGVEKPIEGFDLNNMQGYELMAGGATRQDHCFVLKKDGKIGLYNLTKSYSAPFNPRIYMDITDAPGISAATSFDFNAIEDVVYYVANNIVYAIIFSGREPKYKEVYNPGENIEFINILTKTGQKMVEAFHRFRRRNRFVINIAGDQNRVRLFKTGQIQDLGENKFLILSEIPVH